MSGPSKARKALRKRAEWIERKRAERAASGQPTGFLDDEVDAVNLALALLELGRPGPIRARALAAGAARARMSVGVCGDRARALAADVLDAALQTAQEGTE